MSSLFYCFEKCLTFMNTYIIGKKNQFDIIALKKKKKFYNHLNMKDITGTYYAHTKRVS